MSAVIGRSFSSFYLELFFFILKLLIQVLSHTIRLPKQSTVGDVLDDLKTKVPLSGFCCDSLTYIV